MAKIDLSKLKGIFKGLGSYTALIGPVVITIGAALVLTAALLLGRNFKSKVERISIPMGNEVRTLATSAPSSKQVAAEKEYEDAYQSDANQIEQLALQSTQRDLLSYNMFPKPKDTSVLLFTKFGEAYRQQIEGLVAKVRGGKGPSDEELKNSVQTGTGGSSGMLLRGPGFTGTARTGSADTERIAEEICQARAKQISVYVNPADMAGYLFWDGYKYADVDSGVKDCWWWQLGYWIIEDVFTTAGEMNKGSGNVQSSPVKRLVRVGFVAPEKLSGAKSVNTSPVTAQQKPNYVNMPNQQLAEACTGRLSNDDLDIVHFTIVAVISSKDIMPFMKELCSEKKHTWHGYYGDQKEEVLSHNQITILQSAVKPIDSKDRNHKNYRYGNQAVAEVELICEYVFARKAYEKIYPEAFTVKTEDKK